MRTTISFLLALCAGLALTACASWPQRLDLRAHPLGMAVEVIPSGEVDCRVAPVPATGGARMLEGGETFSYYPPLVCWKGRLVHPAELPIEFGK